MLLHYLLPFWTSVMDASLLGRAPCSDSPSQKLLAKDSARWSSELADSINEFLIYSQTGYICTVMDSTAVMILHQQANYFTEFTVLHRGKHISLQLRLLIKASWFPKIHLSSTTFPNGSQVADLNAICKVSFKEESDLRYSFFQSYLQVIYWVIYQQLLQYKLPNR